MPSFLQIPHHRRILITGLALLYGIALLRTGHLVDDALITLRTVLNFLHGFGPTFNIDERVQAYTHPLWFLLLSAASWLIGNVFTAAFTLSIATSLLCYWLFLTRIIPANKTHYLILLGLVLIFSQAYVDFSTSGLENPLSHLLVVLSVLAAGKAVETCSFRNLSVFYTLYSLSYLSRPDLVLPLLPLALWVTFRCRNQYKQLLPAICIGALPAVLWTLFSLYYYGFPFPNTAYVKLNHGFPLGQKFVNTLLYFLRTGIEDTLTIVFICFGAAVGLLCRSGKQVSLSFGILLYGLYLFHIGGDFMTGRFFSVPLLLAVMILAHADLKKPFLTVLFLSLGMLGLLNINQTAFSGSTWSTAIANHLPSPAFHTGIVINQRETYYFIHGLLASNPQFSYPEWVIKERQVLLSPVGGYASIQEGPGTHWLDIFGLADPLLSRMPSKFGRGGTSAPAHSNRPVPLGYIPSLVHDQNMMEDPAMREYYDSIRLITRGKLNDPARLREILRMNLGEIPVPDITMENKEIAARAQVENWRDSEQQLLTFPIPDREKENTE